MQNHDLDITYIMECFIPLTLKADVTVLSFVTLDRQFVQVLPVMIHLAADCRYKASIFSEAPVLSPWPSDQHDSKSAHNGISG